MEEYRDQLGFIEIDKMNISDFIRTKLFDNFSFITNNQRYYFKKAKSLSQVYNELIAYELACDFGIPSIPYDLASYNNSVGVMSKDCMKPGYSILDDLLTRFYKDTKNKCNLDDTVFMLMDTYGDDCNLIVDDLMHMMMFDFIIANHDRHDRNIIIDGDAYRLGPLMDNEMLLSDQALYDFYYSFKVNGKDNNTLPNFIKLLDDNKLLFFYNKIDIISPANIEKVFQRVEAKIGTKMIDAIRKELTTKFAEHYRSLLKVIKEELINRKVLKK